MPLDRLSISCLLALLLPILLIAGCPEPDDDDTSADDDDIAADDDDSSDDDDAMDDDDATGDDDDATGDDDDSNDDDDALDDDDATADDDDATADDDDSMALPAEIDDLAAHLALFLSNQLGATLSHGPLSLVEVVDSSSDLGALAALISNDWNLVQAGLVDDAPLPNDQWVTPTGAGQGDFEAAVIAPALVDGAVVVQIDWDLAGQPGANYAVVAPGGGAPDEADAFLVAAVDHFRVQDGARDALNIDFLDGFGGAASTVSSELLCSADLCEGSASAQEFGPGCDALTEESTTCLADGTGCELQVAVVAWCGEATFTFDAADFRWVQDADTFGFTYLDVSAVLGESCACVGNEDQDGDSYTRNDGDCDDADADVFPSAAESCDSTDSDCDGSIVDEDDDFDGDGEPDCVDVDDDGDGSVDLADCAELDPTIYPGATESCDDIDSDCDGSFADEFDDTDGDDVPDCMDDDSDGDGVTPAAGDCDDTDASVYPGAPELCDDVDSDCDGSIVDEDADSDADLQPDCIDADDDNDGSDDLDDCDDLDATIFPGAPELCDDIDSDCDGSLVDDYDDFDGDLEPDCIDLDDDQDGDPDDTDCAELDATIYTGAPEACDVVDSDCDGSLVDEDLDSDGDGQPDCVDDDVDGDGFTPVGGDCDDSDPAIHPGAPELCDLIDSDCDGALDDEEANSDTDPLPDCIDEDDDGDGDPDLTDCAALDATIFNGAPELCDVIDSDCDGSLVDEFDDFDGDLDPDCTDEDDDEDGDLDVDDCDDFDPSIYTDAAETCDDAIDQDCNGTDLPCNDLCVDAVEVSVDSPVGGDTTGATFDDVGVCDTENTAPGVWFTYTATGGEVSASTCDAASYDTKISVFSGDCSALVCEAGNDDGSSCAALTSRAEWDSAYGQTYLILVHGFGSATGTFTLTVTEPEPDFDDDGDPDSTDCDVTDPAIYDGAPETCDDVDSDCDGDLVDEFDDFDGDDDPDCIDLDDDNDGDDDATDCADLDASIYNNAPESCDAIDSDCDGSLVDEFDDFDGDLDPDCTDEDDDDDGEADATDCDDFDASIYNAAPESCDAIDSDCDGSLVDEFDDFDGDLDPDCTDEDDDDDGDPDATDCDGFDDTIFYGATEVCDGIDNNCVDGVDEGYADYDGDTLADCMDPPPLGAVIVTEVLFNPVLVSDASGEWFEVYNTTIFDIDLLSWTITDAGTDSHTIAASTVVPAGGFAVLCRNGDSASNGGVACDYEYSGFVLGNSGDEIFLGNLAGLQSDDLVHDEATFPDPDGASMLLDPASFDEAANNLPSAWCTSTVPFGLGDLGTPGLPNEPDADGDGVRACEGDCDESDPSIYGGAPELCDGLDNDCEGDIDEGYDVDADGFTACGADGDPAATADNDCDDSNPATFPGSPEVCGDAIDNDCDASTIDLFDADSDGSSCSADCADSDPAIYPGAPETCGDGVDQDCNGSDLACPACDSAVEVEYNGTCYYLDGSRGLCDPGYVLAPQSILYTIADMFLGKNYKHAVSTNCCITHADQAAEGQDWGMGDHCNTNGPFTANDPIPNGANCTNANQDWVRQLTLCRSQ